MSDEFRFLKTNRFDTAALFAALDARRELRGLTWSQVAAETGIAASTIVRTQRGRRMEGAGAMTLLSWLGLPPETFLKGPRAELPLDLPGQLSNLLRTHRELPDDLTADLEATAITALASMLQDERPSHAH